MTPSIERIRSALSFILPDDRDVWVRMGMAVKAELADEGFDLWDAWGQGAASYNQRSSRDVWKSIRPGGGITVATLFAEAKAQGWQDDTDYHAPTPAELAERQRKAQEQAAREAAQVEAERAEARAKAQTLWNAASACPNEFPYLVKKQVKAVSSLRVIASDMVAQLLGYTPKSDGEPLAGDLLVVPIKQGDTLSSVELIDGNGRKTALAGRGSKAGGYWAAQRMPESADTVLIAEGMASALTAQQETGYPAVAGLSAHNLPEIARQMRQRYPDARLVILAERVKTTGEVDKRSVESAQAAGGLLAIPDFGPEREAGWTDINDLFVLHGGDVVRACIENAVSPVACSAKEGVTGSTGKFNPINTRGNTSPAQTADASYSLADRGSLSATPLPPNNDKGFRVADSDLQTDPLPVSATSKPAPDKAGSGVADKTGGEGETGKAPASIPTPEDEDAYIRHLAGLKVLAYGRVRKGAAEALGVPVGILDKLVNGAQKELGRQQNDEGAGGRILFDEVEPWPTDVDGAAVLDAAYQLLSRYVIADKETLRTATLWAAMTWFTDYATVLPLAVITAPEKGCGKSTLLNALTKLSCRPLYASNITPAALFRTVEAWKPTLMIDEADTFAKDNEELRGVLNAGHTRETATIVRVVEVGGELQPRAFSVWGAKALAGIGNLPDTIMSRAVVLTMRRKTAGEKADNLRHADHAAFHTVKRQMSRWSDDMGEVFGEARPDVGKLNNRAADNWEPLLALADLAGGEWPRLARVAAMHLNGDEEESLSVNEELLRDIRSAFERKRVTKLWTNDLIAELCEDEEAQWATYNFRTGKPISARQLSKRLNEFGIKPKDIRQHFEVRKGYCLEDFTDAFSRYLEGGGNLSATALQPNNHAGFSVADSDLGASQKHLSATDKPTPDKACSAVADKTGGNSGKTEGDDDAEYF